MYRRKNEKKQKGNRKTIYSIGLVTSDKAGRDGARENYSRENRGGNGGSKGKGTQLPRTERHKTELKKRDSIGKR